MPPLHRFCSLLRRTTASSAPVGSAAIRLFSNKTTNSKTGDDEWNDAWETAWLPDDDKSPYAPWESEPVAVDQKPQTDVGSQEMDGETKVFMEDMNENWDRRKGKSVKKAEQNVGTSSSSSLYSLENIKRDYRVKKQKIHAGLWVKEIEKMEEAKLGISNSGGDDDIEKLLDSYSDIFDSANNDLNNSKILGSEFKNKPDGWETMSNTQDGNIWEMTQREEDILVQEFERRIAFNKFQIASFIKTHIFSRRRPIDGWKYMIEEIGPNAKKGKGSVTRLPSVSDESTQPFREERPQITSTNSSYGRR